MKRTLPMAIMLFALLASCKGFVAYPDQTGWSHFFLDRKGQVSLDSNGQYRAQLKIELFRPLPVGSRFELRFEKLGSFGAANSVVTLPGVTTYRFRSKVIEGYQPEQSVPVIVAVYIAGESEPIERIRVIVPYAEPEAGEKKAKKTPLDLFSSNDSPENETESTKTSVVADPVLSATPTPVVESQPKAPIEKQSSWPSLSTPFQALKLPSITERERNTFKK